LPDHLPRVDIEHDLTDEEKVFACGCQLTRIGEEVSEQLDIIPAKIQVLRHIRPKYACKGCEETMRTAPLPPQPIPKSNASPGLLSHIVVAKYQDALPLAHQEKQFARIGAEVTRATMARWMIRNRPVIPS
jgi:transposase